MTFGSGTVFRNVSLKLFLTRNRSNCKGSSFLTLFLKSKNCIGKYEFIWSPQSWRVFWIRRLNSEERISFSNLRVCFKNIEAEWGNSENLLVDYKNVFYSFMRDVMKMILSIKSPCGSSTAIHCLVQHFNNEVLKKGWFTCTGSTNDVGYASTSDHCSHWPAWVFHDAH